MESTPLTDRTLLEITGMSCAACAARIEKTVGRLDGVVDVQVNLAMHSAAVKWDPSRLSLERIAAKIEGLGFGAKRQEAEGGASRAEQAAVQQAAAARRAFGLSLLFMLPFLWIMAGHHVWTQAIPVPHLLQQPWVQLLLATPVQFGLGLPFYQRAWTALRSGSASMDVLVMLGTSAAYFYSHYLMFHPVSGTGMDRMAHGHGGSGQPLLYFDTSVMIITIVWLGRWMEAAAKQRTVQGIARLRELQPAVALRLLEGSANEVPLEWIREGELLLVKPGAVIPLDGIIEEGWSSVNESLLTGESLPVDKGPGARVYGGSLNGAGALRLRVLHAADRSTVARMASWIESAQSSRAPIQRVADRLAGGFVPCIIALSAGAFIYWYGWGAPGETGGALEKAIAVLLIACPCALGLATPVSVLVGSGRAAHKGILFKEGRFLEELQGAKVLLLDKTGTLTHGSLRFTELVTAQPFSQTELLMNLAAAEAASEHPAAHAILAEAHRRGLRLPAAGAFQAVPGSGIHAEVEGRQITAGNFAWLQEQGIVVPAEMGAHLAAASGQGKLVVHTAVNGRWAGAAVLTDTLKPHAGSVVRELKRLGLTVILVTGDQEGAARRIAGQMGISRWYAGMRPDAKLRLVQRLQEQGHRVAMAGDGLNDAPALAAAHVGIAMGSGTDLTKAAGDITLLHNNMQGLAEAYRISRATLRNVYQNLLLSLGYNVLAIPLAFAGHLAPWMACSAMALSSVTVVCNALRLQRL